MLAIVLVGARGAFSADPGCRVPILQKLEQRQAMSRSDGRSLDEIGSAATLAQLCASVQTVPEMSDLRSSSRRCERRGRPPADGPRLSGGRPEPSRRAPDASSSTLSLTRTLRPYQGPHALQGGGPALDPRNFRSNASYIKTSPRGELAEKSPKSRLKRSPRSEFQAAPK